MGYFDAVPAILVRTAGMATPLAVSGGLLVVQWIELKRKQQQRRVRQAYAAIGVSLLIFAGAVIVAGASDIVRARQAERRFTFDYRAVLEPNGTGLARVSLPIPVEEVLLRGLIVTPSSSATAMNRSGAEPALDVILSTPTWVNASFTVFLEPGETHPTNLTRTVESVGCRDCDVELGLKVLSGSVRDVRVTITARWSRPCFGTFWTVEAVVRPGAATYPSEWSFVVC